MPAINKELMEKTIKDLTIKIRTENEKVDKLDRTLNCLSMLLPDERIDERTGKVMTDTARQKIYIDNMAEAKALLA